MAKEKEALQAIIDKEKEIIGEEMAVKKAGSVEGLELSDEGEVVHVDDGEEALHNLVDAYKQLGGSVAFHMMAEGLENVDTESIDLPQEIEERL